MTLLSESGEELQIFNGHTELRSIRQEMDAVIGYTQDEEQEPITGKLVTAVLRKPDETKQRLTSLEETVDTLVMESLDWASKEGRCLCTRQSKGSIKIRVTRCGNEGNG